MKKRFLFMACLGLCACLLTACTKETSFSAGTEMSADELRLYRERLLAQKQQEEDAENKPAADVEELVCYYAENGSVWHIDRECSYLKRSKNVLEGSVEGAAIAGKTRPCSGCASAYIEE